MEWRRKKAKLRIGNEQPRLRYPWAIAPTIITTKPVATAIATLVSIDKLTIFPSIMAATPSPRFFDFAFLGRFEFQGAYGCQARLEVQHRAR
jgi:hypothetical protein